MKIGLLIIDHGSRLEAANDMIFQVVEKLKQRRKNLFIEGCHMELAEPSIATGFNRCVELGATFIVAQPFMLSPGRHSTKDIPELVKQAAHLHPNIKWTVQPHFGLHDLISDIILDNALLDQSSS